MNLGDFLLTMLDEILKVSSNGESISNVESGSNGVSINDGQYPNYPESSLHVVPSVQSTPEESRENQKRLIELLTGRGGITEVLFLLSFEANYLFIKPFLSLM